MDYLTSIANWSNDNQGVLTIILFFLTLFIGWATGIISALRRKPDLRVRLLEGPTYVCTYGTGGMHGEYPVHRTGIALYLHVSNVGSAPAFVEEIEIGYHWAVQPLKRMWWRYGLRRFWLTEQAVVVTDFQTAIGDNVKFYPFMTQISSISGSSADRYVNVGASTNGVVYFEQADSFGACFPKSRANIVRLKIRIRDSFGRSYSKISKVRRVTLDEARVYNPSFGLTRTLLNGENPPFDLPSDDDGNLISPRHGL